MTDCPCEPLIIIAGPTASGKTDAAVALARMIGGAVISADSQQVFRGLDIGTATPTLEECGEIEYTGIDLIAFDEQFDAARFMTFADAELQRHAAAGLRSIIAGGTGLYIKALLEGLFEGPASDPELRSELNRRVQAEGAFALHGELNELDPEAAAKIHHNDPARIVRALEVCRLTGRRISELQRESRSSEPRWPFYLFVLDWPREELYSRIDRRVTRMLDAGWLEEIKVLRGRGFNQDCPGAKALGYSTLLRHLDGELSLDEAITQIQRDSRRYAKRQLTWFRARPEAHWIPMNSDAKAEDIAHSMLCAMQKHPAVRNWEANDQSQT
ncbi:tRNA (adenosine(37)-N6)-dimethylallyltransferase MiaA [Candidatus Sumerlaeota bacterium]|nr:tRNA (adenosine(37)-N6)-dimethylallyltransferase MiaA [Candidatus Sumerlaeota bacterium]